MKRVALGAVLLATTVYGQNVTRDGGFKTGQDLYNICMSDNVADNIMCFGYIQGVIDTTVVTMNEVGGSCDMGWGKTVGQLRMEFLKLYRNNPENGHLSAARYITGLALANCTMPEPKKDMKGNY